ncbi:hypothetical protein F4778DRAFT_232643 [Xylariomycetidae sp. FL2044]|nr:hypothetical protein F4778DRAFT_232643 [Xylariomycetidae sp. FL2044]
MASSAPQPRTPGTPSVAELRRVYSAGGGPNRGFGISGAARKPSLSELIRMFSAGGSPRPLSNGDATRTPTASDSSQVSSPGGSAGTPTASQGPRTPTVPELAQAYSAAGSSGTPTASDGPRTPTISELAQAYSAAGSSKALSTFSTFSNNSDIEVGGSPPPRGGWNSSGGPLSSAPASPSITETSRDPPTRSQPTAARSAFNRTINWVLGPREVTNEEETPEVHFESHQPRPQRLPLIDEEYIDVGTVQDICPACTTPYDQAVESMPFKSSLRLSYNDPRKHTWFIGDKYALTEVQGDDHPEDVEVPLVLATRAIKKTTRVPVPNVIAGWREHGKVITISERVSGERLYDIWWTLTPEKKDHIAKQVAGYMEQWREMPMNRIASFGGGAVRHHDNLFGTLGAGTGTGPFRSDHDFWLAIYRRLEQRDVPPELVQVLRDYMPASSPCTLTHGDLSSTNIYVHHGRVSAITGFDHVAALPVWAENVAMHFCYCREDEQWKALLSRHMRSYRSALDWWALWTAVEDENLSQARLDALVDRCQRWQKTVIDMEPFVSSPSDDEDDHDGDDDDDDDDDDDKNDGKPRVRPPVLGIRRPRSGASYYDFPIVVREGSDDDDSSDLSDDRNPQQNPGGRSGYGGKPAPRPIRGGGGEQSEERADAGEEEVSDSGDAATQKSQQGEEKKEKEKKETPESPPFQIKGHGRR